MKKSAFPASHGSRARSGRPDNDKARSRVPGNSALRAKCAAIARTISLTFRLTRSQYRPAAPSPSPSPAGRLLNADMGISERVERIAHEAGATLQSENEDEVEGALGRLDALFAVTHCPQPRRLEQ